MFNFSKSTDRGFRENMVLGGCAVRDADSYRTMSCGKLTILHCLLIEAL